MLFCGACYATRYVNNEFDITQTPQAIAGFFVLSNLFNNNMRWHLQHMRFTNTGEQLLSSKQAYCSQRDNSVDAIGMQQDNTHTRPCYACTQV